MQSDPTELYLPQTFPYPIKVVSLDANLSSTVQRGTRLLSYSYVYIPKTPNFNPETRFGTWDSAIEGTLDSWKLKVGDVISQARSKDRPAVVIVEPCKHGMQVGGLCVLCGKDMTNIDYTGFSDASRASIQMTHSAFGPTVSLEEAQKIERETADHLLKSRKLSLIVDLDQTIVHATVDPTVGEWITEGEAWEDRQAKKNKKSSTSADSDDSDEDSSDEDDDCNPNWEALKDIKKFRLGPESFGNSSMRVAQRAKGKHKMVENEGCMYYIKPRPGWKEFLEEASKKYEMHVYTMGTRAYAEEVCSAIDPDRKIFGNRLLSRDESGSLTQKSLHRLFPCDTSMVVIIDDRADVWEWSPNLIKVIPYDFFVGIGDINSTFLPKLDASTPLSLPQSPILESEEQPPSEANGTSPLQAVEATSPQTKAALPAVDRLDAETKTLLTQNNAALDAQLEERPLAKKQEELQEHELELEAEQTTVDTGVSATESPSTESDKQHHQQHHHKKALLKNDDVELQRVGNLLNEVHNRFFASYDARTPASSRRKLGPGSRSHDVTRIIPRIRTEVLDGVYILFSGLIPLDTKPETTEIWRSATMFGARCSTELTNDVTHVVAAKRGTVKVDMARKRGNIAIVSQAWLNDSIAQWRRLEEKPYLLDDPPVAGPSSSPATESHQISSDPDMDDDWEEEETFDSKETGALELTAIDWSDINDEVEAAMNESDDDDGDDGKSDRSGMRSANASEDEWDDSNSVKSTNNSPRLKRKRLRSATPSDNGDIYRDDLLRSPLAKRKKMMAERTGLSRLKEGITADDLRPRAGGSGNGGAPASARSSPKLLMQNELEEEEDEGEEEEEEDDFLARELEEEWG